MYLEASPTCHVTQSMISPETTGKVFTTQSFREQVQDETKRRESLSIIVRSWGVGLLSRYTVKIETHLFSDFGSKLL